MHKIRINPLARQDLLDIRDYITNELDSPNAAVNVISKLLKAMKTKRVSSARHGIIIKNRCSNRLSVFN